MKAIDTNVALRLITGDDQRQAEIGRELLAQSRIVITNTVIMEVEWVLRSAYKWSRLDVANAIFNFVSLEMVSCENLALILWAIDRSRAGADFADMIHLCDTRRINASAFVTFDRQLAPRAGDDAPVSVETLM